MIARESMQMLIDDDDARRSHWRWKFAFTTVNTIQLLLLGFLINSLVFGDIDIDKRLWLFILSVLLAAVIKGQGWFVLLAIQVGVAMREPGTTRFLFDFPTWVFCSLTVIAVGYAYCFQTLGHRYSQRVADLLFSVLGPKTSTAPGTAIEIRSSGSGQGNLEPSSQMMQVTANITEDLVAQEESAGTYISPQPHRAHFSELVQGFSVLAVATGAMILLIVLPVTRVMRQEWVTATVAGATQYIWPGPFIVTLLIGLIVFAREISWRRLSTIQAGQYLRGETFLYYFRDLRMMWVWTTKRRKKLEARRAADFRKK